MFTGLIETTGTLRRVSPMAKGKSLTVATNPALVGELSLGESIAVDGACLTVTRVDGDAFEVEASSETLGCTTLGERRVGDRVHLERALRLSDRLGGHLVAGHVDGTGAVLSREPLGEALTMRFSAPPQVARFLVAKGSIAIDGVSLTVNEVEDAAFSVVLIPHTQGIVHLHTKPVQARVNLEADLIGKYVERLLGDRGQPTGGVSLSLLRRQGFTE